MSYDLDAFDAALFQEAHSIMKDKMPIMVEGYLEDARMYIDKIKEGFESGDKNTVAQYAHPLKSSSAGLGIMSISTIAKDLEYGAKEALEDGSEIGHLQALLDPIEEAFQRAEPRLKQCMENAA